MLDLFSTREVSWGIWLIILTAFVFIHKMTRKHALAVFRAAMQKTLVILFLILVMVTLFWTKLFSNLSIWDSSIIKEIVLWFLFVGVPACFGAISHDTRPDYFKKIIVNNIKMTIFLEFIISTFTFSLGNELLLIPVLTIIALLAGVAETNKEFEPAYRLISWVQTVAGFMIIGFTLKNAVSQYVNLSITGSLISFVLPLILSILYAPIAYLFGVYARYDTVFRRMSIKEPDDKTIRKVHKWKIFKAFKLSYRKILRFEREGLQRMYSSMDETEFDSLVNKITADQDEYDMPTLQMQK